MGNNLLMWNQRTVVKRVVVDCCCGCGFCYCLDCYRVGYNQHTCKRGLSRTCSLLPSYLYLLFLPKSSSVRVWLAVCMAGFLSRCHHNIVAPPLPSLA